MNDVVRARLVHLILGWIDLTINAYVSCCACRGGEGVGVPGYGAGARRRDGRRGGAREADPGQDEEARQHRERPLWDDASGAATLRPGPGGTPAAVLQLGVDVVASASSLRPPARTAVYTTSVVPAIKSAQCRVNFHYPYRPDCWFFS